jgi:mono/diheme cytochrome c family protein
MRTLTSAFFALGCTTLALAYSTARAQEPARSVLEGVYTDAQAKRGEKVYTDACATCHGPRLAGTDTGPTLAGADFINGWKEMSLGALLNKINMDMPSNAPATLAPEEYADVLAYVLSFNRYPAGPTELPTDPEALRPVRMAAAPAEPAGQQSR